MRGKQDDLFGEDDDSMTAPENEVMNFIQRRKKMNERTTLSDLKEQFSKKPYGWQEMAVWCMTAMLFKRGKIEGKQDSNILEDSEFLDALMNSRAHSNTLIHPQIEFDQGQIRKLKEIHRELFNESNPHNEAKEAATYFKEKATDELESITSLIAQRQNYPFMQKLKPLAEHLRNLRQMDYATLITGIGSVEDEILDLKEDVLDPIKQFMTGGQRGIYDRLREFEGYNQANFSYIDADEKQVISDVKEDATPYLGSAMKDAKEAMDALENRVKVALQGEKEATKQRVQERLNDLENRPEFGELSLISNGR